MPEIEELIYGDDWKPQVVIDFEASQASQSHE